MRFVCKSTLIMDNDDVAGKIKSNFNSGLVGGIIFNTSGLVAGLRVDRFIFITLVPCLVQQHCVNPGGKPKTVHVS